MTPFDKNRMTFKERMTQEEVRKISGLEMIKDYTREQYLLVKYTSDDLGACWSEKDVYSRSSNLDDVMPIARNYAKENGIQPAKSDTPAPPFSEGYSVKAKVIGQNQWVIGSLIQNGNSPIIVADLKRQVIDTPSSGHWSINAPAYFVDGSTICRPTGLRSSTGIHIWEGDVYTSARRADDGTILNLFEIVFHNGAFCAKNLLDPKDQPAIIGWEPAYDNEGFLDLDQSDGIIPEDGPLTYVELLCSKHDTDLLTHYISKLKIKDNGTITGKA